MYVYEECMCNAHGGWNRKLELELQMVANHFVDAGNQTRVGPLDCLAISPTFLHVENILLTILNTNSIESTVVSS